MFRRYAVVVSLFLIACSSGTEPLARLRLASALSAARFADDAFVGGGYAVKPANDGLDPSSCTYDAGIQGFDCADADRATALCGAQLLCVALSRHVQLFVYDAAGRSLSTYSSEAGTRLRVVSDVTARYREGSGIGSVIDEVRRHSDVTVDGLASAVRTVNGTFAQVDSFVPLGIGSSLQVLRATGSATNIAADASASFPKAGVLTWSSSYDPPQSPGTTQVRLTFQTPPLAAYEYIFQFLNPPQTWGCSYDLSRGDCLDAYVQKS